MCHRPLAAPRAESTLAYATTPESRVVGERSPFDSDAAWIYYTGNRATPAARFQSMAAEDKRPMLEPRSFKGTNAWYVHIEWPDGSFEQVGVFDSKSQAEQWIDVESGAWLRTHVHRMGGPKE
jgi:hypothetical protein